MYTRENYQKIKDRINERRQNAEAAADRRRAELALKSPRIKEIDAEMRGVGLEIFKAACAGADMAPIRERNLALGEERRRLIKALGYAEDYDLPKYSCPLCSD